MIFKGVSRVFQEENFHGVSKKIMLCSTHRSFRTKRWACLVSNENLPNLLNLIFRKYQESFNMSGFYK